MVVHLFFFFFFNDTATTEIYTLSLHDALPISGGDHRPASGGDARQEGDCELQPARRAADWLRSEEHTSELQSQSNLVCRLLLEKKKNLCLPIERPIPTRRWPNHTRAVRRTSRD